MPYLVVNKLTKILDEVLAGDLVSAKPTSGSYMDVNKLGWIHNSISYADVTTTQQVTGFAANSFVGLGVAQSARIPNLLTVPYFASPKGHVFRNGKMIGLSVPKVTALQDLDGTTANYVYVPNGQTMVDETTTLTGTRIDPRGGYSVFYNGYLIARYNDKSKVYAVGADARSRPARVVKGLIQVSRGTAYFQVEGWPACRMSGGQIAPANALAPGLAMVLAGSNYVLQVTGAPAALTVEATAGPFFDANSKLLASTKLVLTQGAFATDSQGMAVLLVPDATAVHAYYPPTNQPSYYFGGDRILQFVDGAQWMLGTILTYEATGAISYTDKDGIHALMPRFTTQSLATLILILLIVIAVLLGGGYLVYRTFELVHHHFSTVQ